jgi:hypothetical protein
LLKLRRWQVAALTPAVSASSVLVRAAAILQQMQYLKVDPGKPA